MRFAVWLLYVNCLHAKCRFISIHKRERQLIDSELREEYGGRKRNKKRRRRSYNNERNASFACHCYLNRADTSSSWLKKCHNCIYCITANLTNVSNSSDSSANYFLTSNSTRHVKITEFSCSN